MKIQILSDLHLEHGGVVPEHHPDADVIVLAGDLAPYTEGLIEQLAEHWSSTPHILYVLGNHEFYGTEIEETRSRLAKECAQAGIHLLDPGMVQIEGIRFIGATLWTDLLLEGKADEIGAHMRVSREISDFLPGGLDEGAARGLPGAHPGGCEAEAGAGRCRPRVRRQRGDRLQECPVEISQTAEAAKDLLTAMEESAQAILDKDFPAYLPSSARRSGLAEVAVRPRTVHVAPLSQACRRREAPASGKPLALVPCRCVPKSAI